MKESLHSCFDQCFVRKAQFLDSWVSGTDNHQQQLPQCVAFVQVQSCFGRMHNFTQFVGRISMQMVASSTQTIV